MITFLSRLQWCKVWFLADMSSDFHEWGLSAGKVFVDIYVCFFVVFFFMETSLMTIKCRLNEIVYE